MAGPSGFVINPAWREVVGAATLAGGRALGLRAMALAVEICPRSHPEGQTTAHVGGPPLYQSHFMTENLSGELGWVIRVGANKSYAYWVHQGTHPHIIQGNPLLAFNWAKNGGRLTIVHFVHHPGTRPQPWLWSATGTIIRSSIAL